MHALRRRTGEREREEMETGRIGGKEKRVYAPIVDGMGWSFVMNVSKQREG